MNNIVRDSQCIDSTQLFISKLAVMMIPMLAKILAVEIDVCNILGCSSKCRILLKAGCFFLLRILISLMDKEKKAISLPAIKNDKRKSAMKITISMPVTDGLISNIESGAVLLMNDGKSSKLYKFRETKNLLVLACQ